MDNSTEVTHLLAQIATEEASLAKLCNIKETLQNQEELQKVQGVKRKQQDKHTHPKKKQKAGQNTNTHCAGMSNNIYHGTNMASTNISTRDKVCMAKTSINAQKEHLVMAKSSPLTTVRNPMGEFDGVKITQKNVKQRKKTLQNEEYEQQDGRQ